VATPRPTPSWISPPAEHPRDRSGLIIRNWRPDGTVPILSARESRRPEISRGGLRDTPRQAQSGVDCLTVHAGVLLRYSIPMTVTGSRASPARRRCNG
jgi:thiamine biosynthesis protein ThiC